MTALRVPGIQACIFDAYGTLFDVSSVARGARDILGEDWEALSTLWRSKQLQYTWLRGLGGRHADFWQVTGDALDFALAAQKLDSPGLRERLMQLYLELSTYPEVPDTLRRLKAAGMKLAILSNGTPTMLASAIANAGIADVFDAVLSVEEVGVYKPHPAVYLLGCERLDVTAAEACFLSSNSWDAYAAKAFGYQVLWCNRFGQVAERLPGTPNGVIGNLAELPDAVLA